MTLSSVILDSSVWHGSPSPFCFLAFFSYFHSGHLLHSEGETALPAPPRAAEAPMGGRLIWASHLTGAGAVGSGGSGLRLGDSS